MGAGNVRRLLTGAARNGVVWGIAWFALAFVTILVLRTIGVIVPATIGVLDAIGMAIRIGIVGGIAAGGSMWLAQRSEPGADEAPDALAGSDPRTAIGAGDPLASLDAADARRRAPARGPGGDR